MSDKPIDLGKLQDAHRNADKAVKSAVRDCLNKHTALQRAQSALDKSEELAKKASVALDNAKRLMLEGARSLANNS